MSNINDRFTTNYEEEDLTPLEGWEADVPFYSDICDACVHVLGYRICKAFDIIPLDIWKGDIPHTEPYIGDKGIRFERNPKVEIK